MLINLTCKDFIEELASNSPAPGGGSVAALAGSLGAALVSMVANLTVGKEKFKADEDELKNALDQAQKLLDKLKECVDKDTEAFNRVMAAFKLPKETDEEKKIRSETIQKSMQDAASLPMEVAELCLEVLKVAKIIALKGNPNAISDGGVAALMALSGLQGALLNVDINLTSLKDKEFVQKMAEKKNKLLKEGISLKNETMEIVETKIKA